jgi:hypothetical protein
MLNGITMFERLVQQGTGGGLGDSYKFEFLSVTPDHAEVQLVDSNGNHGLKMGFNKEYNKWKLNLVNVAGQLGKSDWQQL